jgi:hypothetical protein
MTVEDFIPTPQAVSDAKMEEEILAKLPPQDRERTRNLFSQRRKLEQTDIRTRIELDWNKESMI